MSMTTPYGTQPRCDLCFKINSVECHSLGWDTRSVYCNFSTDFSSKGRGVNGSEQLVCTGLLWLLTNQQSGKPCAFRPDFGVVPHEVLPWLYFKRWSRGTSYGSIVFPSKEGKSASIKTIIHYPLQWLLKYFIPKYCYFYSL